MLFMIVERFEDRNPGPRILEWRDVMEFEVVRVAPSKAVREMFETG